MNFILPEIVSVGIFSTQNKKVTKKRKSTMFEIEIPVNNGGISYIASESAQIEPSMIICVKPGQVRYTKPPFKCYYIHFILKNGMIFERLMDIPSFIKTDSPEKYIKIFKKLNKYYEAPGEDEQIILHSLVMELIYTILKDSHNIKNREHINKNNYVIIEHVIKYIKENLTADLSLEKVAAFAGMSPIHFHNCFKTATAHTLRCYVEELRIKKAANMLTTTDYTLTRIAHECGFSSQAYFSYAFKRKMNLTPREYAKAVFERYEKDV